jgi:uncharacterized protein YkwD
MARGSTSSAGRAPDKLALALALFATASAAFLALALQPGLAPAAAACAHAQAKPHQVSLSKLRGAVTCLVNHERSKRNRDPLKPDRDLKSAAQRHNRRMLARNCFKHRCPHEHTLGSRVKHSGYADGATSFRFGEDLGFDNTPRQLVKRLLHSKPNRRRMLKADFRDVGVGVGWGAPVAHVDDARFATYTIVFAWRKPKP